MGLLVLLLVLGCGFFLLMALGAHVNGTEEGARPTSPVRDAAAEKRRPVSPRADRPATASVREERLTPPDPAGAVRESESCWVAPGNGATVSGYEIPGGMVYVGGRMRSLRGWSPDPALIDPSLPVDVAVPDRSGRFMNYWPAYSKMEPQSRAAYLEWLAAGRRTPDCNIGYVFVFLYGLERRALLDMPALEKAQAEQPLLAREIGELLQVYGDHRSFAGYASALLELLELPEKLAEIASLEPPADTIGWELPLSLRLGLGVRIGNKEPIPPDWALSWLRCGQGKLRTAAQRCPDEFDELFRIRYAERYADGMRVREPKSRLSPSYRPASSTFPRDVTLELPDLPDVARLQAPVERLNQLAEQVCDELDGYSRWVGRNEDRSSPAALALLPPELIEGRLQGESERFASELQARVAGGEIALIETERLVSFFPSRNPDRLTKGEAERLGDLLAGLGYGIEPDVRYGGPNPSRSPGVAVFPLSDAGDPAPGEAYHSAAVLLHLGAAVAGADDVITVEEEEYLESQLEEGLELNEAERSRLRAHLRWLLSDPPDLRGLKKRVEGMPDGLKSQIGRFLITVAGADGYVSPEELRLLSKIYPLLGLDPDHVFSEAHALAAAPGPPASDPVTVLPAEPRDEFAVPRPDAPSGNGVISLDMDKVAAVQEQTREAREVLGAVFVGEPEDAAEAEPDEAPTSAHSIGGLDSQHSDLLRMAARQELWPRGEFLGLAEAFGLMPSGAIEIINDASFTLCDEPVFEGDDPIEVNPYAMQEMLS